MPTKKHARRAGRPKSAEVRKKFDVMLLEREKRELRAAMRREGANALSAWIVSKALQAARAEQ